MANNKISSKQTNKLSAFQLAVECTEDVSKGFCVGKKAIKNSDRNKVNASDSRKLQGSLDIDSQVKIIYPQSPRWDYALSYNDIIYYIEIHPAETSEIDTIVNKVKWLKEWLKTKAPAINKLPKAEYPYIWVQSGRFAILPTSKDKMKLSAAGVISTNILNLK